MKRRRRFDPALRIRLQAPGRHRRHRLLLPRHLQHERTHAEPAQAGLHGPGACPDRHPRRLSLEVNRGPVGARIGVLGRGFTPEDRIGFDGTPVRTVYESPTSLGFFVPALTPGRTYQVTLSGDKGNSVVGTFKIDSSDLSVDPASLNLAPGQKQSLTFTLTRPAPAGGTLLDVTTDVPESVIMPEVVVPEGQSSVTVTVEGGKPGTGSLFLKGYGSGEVTIPVTVSR